MRKMPEKRNANTVNQKKHSEKQQDRKNFIAENGAKYLELADIS